MNYLDREKKKLEALYKRHRHLCEKTNNQHLFESVANCCHSDHSHSHDLSMEDLHDGSIADVTPMVKSYVDSSATSKNLPMEDILYDRDYSVN